MKDENKVDIGIRFYEDDFSFTEQLGFLKEVVDNGTYTITIPTPEGWKCEHCDNPVKHTHGVYSSLKN